MIDIERDKVYMFIELCPPVQNHLPDARLTTSMYPAKEFCVLHTEDPIISIQQVYKY